MPTPSPLDLLENDAPATPFPLFADWFRAAQEMNLLEPSAMTLATATAEGFPDARMVLLRGFDERSFVFYTNYRGQKAAQLEQNPNAALVFFWAELARQVRVMGRVEKVSAEESDAYFRSRPPGHQLGAWVSPQSQVIPGRSFLDERLQAYTLQFRASEAIPRPPHWGGYRVVPHTVEFWQGRENRLHDRLRYRLTGEGWTMERLAP